MCVHGGKLETEELEMYCLEYDESVKNGAKVATRHERMQPLQLIEQLLSSGESSCHHIEIYIRMK